MSWVDEWCGVSGVWVNKIVIIIYQHTPDNLKTNVDHMTSHMTIFSCSGDALMGC